MATEMKNLYVKYERNPKEICVRPEDFDKTRLRITKASTYIKGQPTVQSMGRYLNDEGEACKLYFIPPTQSCYGISIKHKLGTSESDKTSDLIEGIQLGYPITSRETVDNPTDEEVQMRRVIDELDEFCWSLVVYECSLPKAERSVPGSSSSAYLASKEDNDKYTAFKPLFQMQNKTEDKKTVKVGGMAVKDPAKPRIMYVKFVTYGKGRAMECKTQVYGPGNVQDKSGMKYAGELGMIESVWHWKGMFWGSHGATQSWGASCQLEVHEVNFTPIKAGGTARRFLEANNAPVEECEEEDDDNLDDEKDAEFQRPDEPQEQTTQDKLHAMIKETIPVVTEKPKNPEPESLKEKETVEEKEEKSQKSKKEEAPKKKKRSEKK